MKLIKLYLKNSLNSVNKLLKIIYFRAKIQQHHLVLCIIIIWQIWSLNLGNFTKEELTCGVKQPEIRTAGFKH